MEMSAAGMLYAVVVDAYSPRRSHPAVKTSPPCSSDMTGYFVWTPSLIKHSFPTLPHGTASAKMIATFPSNLQLRISSYDPADPRQTRTQSTYSQSLRRRLIISLGRSCDAIPCATTHFHVDSHVSNSSWRPEVLQEAGDTPPTIRPSINVQASRQRSRRRPAGVRSSETGTIQTTQEASRVGRIEGASEDVTFIVFAYANPNCLAGCVMPV